MTLFAQVENNIVTEILDTKTNSFQLETLMRGQTGTIILLISIDGISPEPQVGWTYNNGTFSGD